MLIRRVLGLGLVVPLVVALPRTQSLSVGDPAPQIKVASWLNWEGDAPTIESLKGRVVLVEFWGTWCGPCVRAMPGIQKLHDRYASRGLTVLAISYEAPSTMEPFLTKNAFTMPVGSDPTKTTISLYPVRGWPTTVIIDQVGKIAHIGSPYDAEEVVERVLGLEAGPSVLLTTYLDSLKSKKDDQREPLARLLERAPHSFDLQSWARGHLEPETVPADGSPTPVDPGVAPAAAKSADAAELLRRCAQAWSSPTQRTPLLQQLANSGPLDFDLAAFARDAMSSTFPLTAAELKTLLQDKKFVAVLDAIAERTPPAGVLSTAAKNKDLSAYCKNKVDDARLMAKKGLMAQLWVFPGALPRDPKVSGEFFGELAVSGMATSEDRKTITGIMLGGEQIKRDDVDQFVQTHLQHALLMDALASGKAPKVADLERHVERERVSMLRDLESRYGKPESRKPQ